MSSTTNEPLLRSDLSKLLSKYISNNFYLYVNDKPITKDMLEVDLENNKLIVRTK